MDRERKGDKDVPLIVDLDRTLVSTDTTWESIFLLLKKNILFVFLVPFWLLSGTANLKHKIAERAAIDAALLPYRKEFLSFLREQHAAGRTVVLATSAPAPVAEAIACETGVFSTVHSYSNIDNLPTRRKSDLIIEHYGRKKFDYAGSNGRDLAVFDAARQVIIVAPDRSLSQFHAQNGGHLFAAERPGFKTFAQMLRIHQWLKNLLVFVPAILAHEILNPEKMLSAFLAFIAFCAAASAIYIINDIVDLPVDRKHERKKKRPFASGLLSIPLGLAVSASLLILATLICFFLPQVFALTLFTYLLATTIYTFALKRMLLGDVICLAGLYNMRLVGGMAATDLPPSFWLMTFAMFFFLSLALAKRYVELRSATTVTEKDRIAGRGYRPEDLDIVGQCGVASAFTAALVLALYINSPAIKTLYTYPWLIWPLGPIVLYINVRIWILAHRGDMDDDPVLFIARDWRSQVVIAIGAVLLLIATGIR